MKLKPCHHEWAAVWDATDHGNSFPDLECVKCGVEKLRSCEFLKQYLLDVAIASFKSFHCGTKGPRRSWVQRLVTYLQHFVDSSDT